MQSASVLWHWQHVQTETYLQKLFYRAQPGNYTRLQMLGHGATKVVVLWERSQRSPLQGRLVPWWGAEALVSLWGHRHGAGAGCCWPCWGPSAPSSCGAGTMQ